MNVAAVHRITAHPVLGGEEYVVITCGDARVDVYGNVISLKHVLQGWSLDPDVNVDDLYKAILKAKEVIT